MSKLRLRKVKGFSEGHTASTWQSQDSYPSLPDASVKLYLWHLSIIVLCSTSACQRAFQIQAFNSVCIEGKVSLSPKGVEKETEKLIQIIRLSSISGLISAQWLLMSCCSVSSLFVPRAWWDWSFPDRAYLRGWEQGDGEVCTYIFLIVQFHLTSGTFCSWRRATWVPWHPLILSSVASGSTSDLSFTGPIS